jgi:RP/EB family microtubule-associated protein
MDAAFFVSKSELLQWANGFFRLNLDKIEQCANGAVYCQVIDACHPGSVPMKKVNWSARADHESIPNYKILQQAFDKSGIERHIPVDMLVRGKYQDNLEMLQWIKLYFDRTYQHGVEYDGPAHRFTNNNPPAWTIPKASGSNNQAARFNPTSRPTVDSRQGRIAPSNTTRQPARPSTQGALKEEYEKLREEIVDLKITVDGLETERDFYFQKLRDIEILCQALEATPNPDMTVGKFVEDVQRILYAKDDEEEDFINQEAR